MSDFNPDFPPNMMDTLNNRASKVNGRDKNWNYKNSAWVNISTTGKTKSIICTNRMSIGDKSSPTGGGMTMYNDEGGVRKHKPTLTSVTISNLAGGSDYVDAYLYEVEASFKVFTMGDLDRVERSFFRIGAELLVEFGWRQSSGDGDTGRTYANIHNFSFSMDIDGGYTCTVKAISTAALWQSDEMGDADEPDVAFKDETDTPYVNYFENLDMIFRKQLGLENEKDTLDDIGDSISEGGMSEIYWNDNLDYRPKFVFTLMDVKTSYLIFSESNFIKYTTLGTIVRYIDFKEKELSNGNPEFSYKITPADQPGGDYPYIEAIGSADPTKFILPGNQSSYGNRGKSEREDQMSYWPDRLERKTDDTPIASIAISLDYCNSVYKDLAELAKTKAGVKQNPKTTEFFKKIFEDLEYATGGLVSLTLVPMGNDGKIYTQLSTPPTTMKMQLINRKNVTNKSSFDQSKIYEFKTLASNSILKSVSLDSSFDSDYIIFANQKSKISGKSNTDALTRIYGCGSIGSIESEFTHWWDGKRVPAGAVPEFTHWSDGKRVPAGAVPYDESYGPYSDNPKPLSESSKPLSESSKLLLMRHKYGELGMDEFSVTSYAEACKKYILEHANLDEELKKGRYSEISFTLDLSVTIDGIWGIPLFSPITVDRIPSSFKSKGVKFSITGVDHSFDGQGGWDTSLKTVMRIM